MTGGDEGGLYEGVYEALYSYLSLGNRVIDTDFARYVSNPAALSVYDANHVQSVRADSETAIDSVLALADQLFAGCRHRRIFIDPRTPLEVEAYLTLRDYEPRAELVLLLGADLRIDVPDVLELDLRLVESDDDWSSFEQLLRLDHEEEEGRGIGARSRDLTHQIALTKRWKAPGVRFWLARLDDTDCGFCSSWSGGSGVGIVEDLFTREDFRHRGIATRLIGHCVADSRPGGAGPVVISALVDDTPKLMYADLGFRPVCINRSYLKLVSP